MSRCLGLGSSMSVTPLASRAAAHKKMCAPKSVVAMPDSGWRGSAQALRVTGHRRATKGGLPYVERLAQAGNAGRIGLGHRRDGHRAPTPRTRSAGRCRVRSAHSCRTSAHRACASQRTSSGLSGGKLEIKFYEPGALIPPLECFDAVSKGSIESCWTTPGYHTGKYPALAFFTTVPFGPPIGEFLGVEVVRRRQQVARRDLCQARPDSARLASPSLPRRPAGSATRSSRSSRAEGHEDALLRSRRPGHAEARRLDPAAGRGRHLPGAGARRDRCDRVLDADHGHPARLPSDRQVQLFPGLASAVLGERAS